LLSKGTDRPWAQEHEMSMTKASEESIQGGGGKLFVRAWRPSGTPRAVLAICHGFNAHSGMYAWCGDQFAANDIAAYALDLRGRGKSDGERFYVENFEDYVDDLHRLVSFAKSREPGLPVFVLGHSAGGVTACLYALEHQDTITGLVCEDFAFEVPAPDIALALLKGISHFAPHAHALALKNEDFSRDPEVVKAMDADPLIANEKQPFATMAAIVRADARLKAAFPQITLPVLIIHGTADKAAKPSGSQHFHEHAGSMDKTLTLYEGRYHDPLNDLGKEEVFADILAWIAARLPA
jgi:alpha-beta hydrolase superfamily lysophospholipase